jgi:hypothetical protein
VPLTPGSTCVVEDIKRAFGCSDELLAAWRKAGLQPFNPCTNADIFFVDDVHAFVRRFPVGSPEGDAEREKVIELKAGPKRKSK